MHISKTRVSEITLVRRMCIANIQLSALLLYA